MKNNLIKTITFTLLVLLVISMTASAALATGGHHGKKHSKLKFFDHICQKKGYDFAISAWFYSYHKHKFKLYAEREGYSTDVDGTHYGVSWESDPKAAGILALQGWKFYKYPGGEEGTIGQQCRYKVKKVIMCGNEMDEVPEFSTIGAIIALLGAAGIVVARRNKQ